MYCRTSNGRFWLIAHHGELQVGAAWVKWGRNGAKASDKGWAITIGWDPSWLTAQPKLKQCEHPRCGRWVKHPCVTDGVDTMYCDGPWDEFCYNVREPFVVLRKRRGWWARLVKK